MKAWTVDEARIRMADLCARSEQCRSDIRRKLLSHGVSAGDAEKILDALEDGRFLDEERFARAFVNDKLRFSGWGRLKIRQALRAKFLPSGIVESALRGIDEGEYMDILRKVVASKGRGVDMTDYALRMKVFRSVAARGFEPSLICRILDID